MDAYDGDRCRARADLPEVELAGGNMTKVVRVGDTVRRTAGPWTQTIQSFMRHLHASGFTGVPEPLGIDGEGREIISLLPGKVADYPLPDFAWSAETLVAVARCLRRFHDASVGYTAGPDARWQWPAHEPAEVICHNDFAPYNLMFEDGKLTGVIDFDLASPGPRVYDIAYTAYRFVPLTDPKNPDAPFPGVTAQLERLARFCDAYCEPTATAANVSSVPVDRAGVIGLAKPVTPAEVLSFAVIKLRELVEFIEREAAAGDPAQIAVLARGDVDIYLRDITHIETLRAMLSA